MDKLDNSSERKFDLIIFDFDGVFIEFRWEWVYKSYLTLLASEGIDPNKYFKNMEEFYKWGSPNARENLAKLEIKDHEKACKTYYNAYNQNIRILPYVEDLLQNLTKAGYKMAIVTNRHAYNTKDILGPLVEYFKEIVGSEHVKKHKPDPEGIKLVLKKLRAKKERTIMLGDSPFDMKAGKDAQVKIGAVIWEYGSNNMVGFKEITPDYIIRSEEDFYKLFL